MTLSSQAPACSGSARILDSVVAAADGDFLWIEPALHAGGLSVLDEYDEWRLFEG